VDLKHAGEGSGRLFVVEQAGRIRIIQNGELLPDSFLDIEPLVNSRGNEQGLLGLAFHPDYANNGLFFVNYTDVNGDTVVARYSVSADDPDRADPASAKIILQVDQPFANHNGGDLVFGPDGYLYIGLGDGGSAGDPQGNGQNLTALLGKMLRIDVDNGDPYAIPPDNPFLGRSEVRPEIWAYGLRNPWRYSFDRATGDLYIADVGQNALEEINFQPARRELRMELVRRLPHIRGRLAGRPHHARRRILARRGLFRHRRLRLSRPEPAGVERRVPVWRLLLRPDVGIVPHGLRLGERGTVQCLLPDQFLRRRRDGRAIFA
jgi:hypothetical protein